MKNTVCFLKRRGIQHSNKKMIAKTVAVLALAGSAAAFSPSVSALSEESSFPLTFCYWPESQRLILCE